MATTARHSFRPVTQGGILSPTIFNIVTDVVVWHWLSVVSDNPDHVHGLGPDIKDKAALFYADDGLLGSTDPDWLQQAFDVLVDLFERVGLRTNTDKTKVMICMPGHIRDRVSAAAYKRPRDSQGETYRPRKKRHVSCPECDKDLAELKAPSATTCGANMAWSCPRTRGPHLRCSPCLGLTTLATHCTSPE